MTKDYMSKLANLSETSSRLNSALIGEIFARKHQDSQHDHAYSFQESNHGFIGNLSSGMYIPIVVTNSLAWTTKSIQVLKVNGTDTGIAITKANGDAIPFEIRNGEIRFLAEGMVLLLNCWLMM